MPEITEQELEMLKEYQKMGTPQDIDKALGEGDQIKRTHAISEASNLHGFKPNVLSKLAKDVEIFIDGDKAYVKHDGQETLLQDYAEQEWADFLPSLKANEEEKRPGVPVFVRYVFPRCVFPVAVTRVCDNYWGRNSSKDYFGGPTVPYASCRRICDLLYSFHHYFSFIS